ncbi:MAG: hypothetical protein KBE09_01325 [Candidatus Pacebacteria bacterium]|nr:hypothetical protein [Candidatus Paceibacterota bacterium]
MTVPTVTSHRLRAATSALFFSILFSLPSTLYAADLLFSPVTGNFSVGKEFSVQVSVNPNGTSINAADGEISFDKDLLSVSSVSKDGSVFSLWTADPAFSNTAGTIQFSGGTPTAFTTQGTILTIKFKAKAEGSAKTSFTKGSVLAADGKGTNVYSKGNEGSFVIAAAAAEPPPPPPKAEPVAEEPEAAVDVEGDASITPIAPVLNSNTHQKPDLWYSTSTVHFSWKPPADVTGVRTLLSEKEDDKPTVVQKPTAVDQKIEGVADGVWYFYAQFRNEFGWGEVAKRKVQIDTVLPDEFSVTLATVGEGEPAKFAFKSADALSGLDHYDLKIGDGAVLSIREQDMSNGTYLVPPQEGGVRTVLVRAYDRAGNARETQAELDLPKVDKPSAKGAEDPAANQSPWTIERMLLIVFALTTGGFVAWNMHSRQTGQQDHGQLLQRVLEVREKNDRVFSAMREEFEQLINDFDPKPQLTTEERALLEEIKEVLDISEGLMDTAIEDLKKLVRAQQ